MESDKKTTHIYYINTDCSPSHLFNNLSVTDKNIIYIHNSESQPRVIVVDRKLLQDRVVENLSQYVNKLNSTETNEMLTIKCVNINETFYVAVGLYGGFKLWSSDGSRLLFQIPAKVKTTDKPYAFTSITEYKSNLKSNNWDSIIATDNYGQIFMITGFGQVWRAKLLHSYDGITTTASTSNLNSNLFAVGFETGEVFIFRNKNENSVEVASKLDNYNNLPCLSLIILEKEMNKLAIGYLNGEIRIHNFNNDTNFELILTIGSHLRMLNCMLSYKDYLITCGDDCFINIFKIYTDENTHIENNNQVSLVSNIEMTDKIPVGMAIIEDSNDVSLLVTFYDHTCLALIENLNI